MECKWRQQNFISLFYMCSERVVQFGFKFNFIMKVSHLITELSHTTAWFRYCDLEDFLWRGGGIALFNKSARQKST